MAASDTLVEVGSSPAWLGIVVATEEVAEMLVDEPSDEIVAVDVGDGVGDGVGVMRVTRKMPETT